MHVKCTVTINLEKFYGSLPDFLWRVWHWGKEDTIVRTVLEMFNSISRRDAFWNLDLSDTGRFQQLSYYTKDENMTMSRFIELVKEEAVPIFKSKEMEDFGVYVVDAAIDYNSVTMEPTDFFVKRYR